MTLTFCVNPIQKQKQPQNAENDQNGLKRDMLVIFAKCTVVKSHERDHV